MRIKRMAKKRASNAAVLSDRQWAALVNHGEAMKVEGTFTFKALQDWGLETYGVEVKSKTYYMQRRRRGVSNGKGKGDGGKDAVE
jgi:hypothetical protein